MIYRLNLEMKSNFTIVGTTGAPGAGAYLYKDMKYYIQKKKIPIESQAHKGSCMQLQHWKRVAPRLVPPQLVLARPD
jgi:hypothetical protein